MYACICTNLLIQIAYVSIQVACLLRLIMSQDQTTLLALFTQAAAGLASLAHATGARAL